ncbi:asparagine synthase-related protein [Streptomyces sp. NPDC003691]
MPELAQEGAWSCKMKRLNRRAERCGRRTADLSSGIDSSTVTCLAARSGPLPAVTYTGADLAHDNDLLYARKTVAEVPAAPTT